MEELQSKHRKEQRDLQSRVTQKKKQASKKTRRGVNDECDKLEAELRQKHAGEVAALNGDASVEDAEIPSAQLEDLTLRVDGEEEPPQTNGSEHIQGPNAKMPVPGVAIAPSQAKKGSRQKARLAKRAADQEEQARQAAEEAKNLPDLKQQERERMVTSMKERGLQEKEIRADGHCLYSAVADQLEQFQIPLGSDGNPTVSYKTVRAAAANYIQQHKDDFLPFLEEPLSEYLHKVQDTGEWGGQLELMALAKTYRMNINVLQDFGRVEKIDAGSDGDAGEKAMWLGYYKHGFGLGEHYNSLRKVP